MNNLIMQLKIEKTKFEKEKAELDLKLLRLLNELAQKSCPYFDGIEEIEAEAIEQIGDELLETKKKALEVQGKLKNINRELGE